MQHIEDDLPCFQCGYNLRSLRLQANCPECGYAVEQSTAKYLTQRWPLNAQQACDVMSTGLFGMIVFGLGLIPWAIGLVMLMRRMPRSLYWTPLKHATWVSFLGTIACIAYVLFAYPSRAPAFGINTVVGVYAASLFAHYLCVFFIAIGITSEAKTPLARGVAMTCLGGQLLAVLLIMARDRNVASAAMVLILCGAVWVVVGWFFWMHLSVSLHKIQQDIARKSQGFRDKPGPTHTI